MRDGEYNYKKYFFLGGGGGVLCIIYIKLIKIKETQQVGLKGPKFLPNAFLWGFMGLYIYITP